MEDARNGHNMAASNRDDDQLDEKSVEKVSLKQSKEWFQVKCAARKTLEQSGWVDTVRHTCLMMKDASSSSHESAGIPKQSALVARVQSDAKTRVPDHIKADILQKIKSMLLQREAGQD